jgi:nitrate/nitrite-specific signal transduction histidine kinase
MFRTMNQFEKLTTVELDNLAVKTAKRVDHLQFHARDTHSNRKELARLQERLAKMDAELDRRAE